LNELNEEGCVKARILIVDDNREMARTIAEDLEEHGYECAVEHGGAAALARAKRDPMDLVVTDLRMEEVDGFDLLGALVEHDATTPVILMTAFGSIDTAVEAIKRGAYHYLTKPLKLAELRVFVEKALAERARAVENKSLRKVVSERYSLGNLVGKSAPMRALYETVERVARADSTVLISGESGTGKELVARAVHFNSPRARGPFIPINCTAIPAGLLESELFGHVRGAYTGATAAREGVFVEANGGTLFLDEIGDMSIDLQSRLLRTLEDGVVRPVGGSQAIKVDTRIIAATNQDLARLVRERRFREDLFFRLNVIPIQLPPLRQRPDDVPLLVEHFLDKVRARVPSSPVRRLSPAAMRLLVDHAWPGNVRELEKTVERLVVLGINEVVEPGDLGFLGDAAPSPLAAARDELVSLRELEARYIAWVMQRVGGNKAKAAEVLGVDPSTLYRREKRSGGEAGG
jgi:two-component system response regulator HydG